MKPRVGITVGDYNGVGPEVILRTVAKSHIARICTPVLIGPENVFRHYARKLRLHLAFEPLEGPGAQSSRRTAAASRRVRFIEPQPVDSGSIAPGQLSAEAGACAAAAIERAVRMTMAGELEAIVTGPVSKQAMHMAGVEFPGQTELLQRLTSSSQVAMMLVSKTMRVGLATIHLPLSEVARTLTVSLLIERITTMYEALVNDWRIKRPVLAVLGLNPHAGEGGHLGREELDIIIPALKQLSASGIRLIGPLPADGFFARYQPGDVDAIVAMYHDQGLIPLKLSSAGRAVNVSAGLPIVRTSPDHGTGFNIAGKGIADPSSMLEAVSLAVMIAANRNKAARSRA